MKNKKYVIEALNSKLEVARDNYFRARGAFSRLTEDELNKPYGNSGKTKKEVLLGYKLEVEKWDEVLNENIKP